MLVVCRTWAVLLVSLILAACMATPTGGGPAATGAEIDPLPEPVEIRIVDGDRQQTLIPGDEGFASTVRALRPVVDSIHDQARTFFAPDRFTAEIEPIPHVYVRFEEEEKFTGQGIQWIAAELLIAQPNDEAMLLARAINTVDWSVYLPDDPTQIKEFLDALTNP